MRTLACLDLGSNSFLLCVAQEIEDAADSVEGGGLPLASNLQAGFALPPLRGFAPQRPSSRASQILTLEADATNWGRKKRFKILHESRIITRIGSNIEENQRISNSIFDSALENAIQLIEKAKEFNPREIFCVATRALRIAENADAFCNNLKVLTGLNVNILSPEDEANLSRYAILDSYVNPIEAVCDLGGASLEISVLENGRFISESLPLGSLIGANFLEKNLHFSGLMAWEKRVEGVFNQFGKTSILHNMSPQYPFLIGGTAVNVGLILNNMKTFDPLQLESYPLERKVLENLYHELSSSLLPNPLSPISPLINIKQNLGILSGLPVLIQIFKRLNADTMHLSCRGLRHGILARAFEKH